MRLQLTSVLSLGGLRFILATTAVNTSTSSHGYKEPSTLGIYLGMDFFFNQWFAWESSSKAYIFA